MKKSEWKGYERFDFLYEGREGILVLPRQAAEHRPWIWRTEFFGAFDSADIAMLQEGYFLLYYKVSDMYGCPQAVEYMRHFHTYVTKEFDLYPKPVLFGFSRGGLYAVNYAAAYPQEVDALYLDAPVLDIRSWPGGLGAAPRCEKEWEECKRWYGLTEEEAPAFEDTALSRAELLAKNDIPIILVTGESDQVVPLEENGKPFAKRFKKAGGKMQVIVKPNCGHHPHSLTDVTPIVSFIRKHGSGEA